MGNALVVIAWNLGAITMPPPDVERLMADKDPLSVGRCRQRCPPITTYCQPPLAYLPAAITPDGWP
jgi:hypothetical protein